jgi:hypothetical protein
MIAEQLAQLQMQQSLTVQALVAAYEGRWTGEPPSVEALLLAINPTLAPLATVNYLLTSEIGEFVPPYDPETYMPRQAASWTCSACSLAWVERATQVNPGADEWSAVAEIGTPENINATYGLMDGSGAQLQRVLRDSYGRDSAQGWLNYDQAYATYGYTTGMMSGGNWYHWVAVRGHAGSDLYIANSAPGYKGVNSLLSREQFNALGPFSCVWLT